MAGAKAAGQQSRSPTPAFSHGLQGVGNGPCPAPRRLRKGAGADITASGATRIAGSLRSQPGRTAHPGTEVSATSAIDRPKVAPGSVTRAATYRLFAAELCIEKALAYR